MLTPMLKINITEYNYESWIASKTSSNINIRSRVSRKNVFNITESIIQSLFELSYNDIHNARRQTKTL